jgi:hypothetical protein
MVVRVEEGGITADTFWEGSAELKKWEEGVEDRECIHVFLVLH